MKLVSRIICICCIVVSLAHGDDVYFRNGQILRNCRVIETTESKIKVSTSINERTFPRITIEKIVSKPYDPDKPTIVQNQDGSFQSLDTTRAVTPDELQSYISVPKVTGQELTTTHPNIYLLPMSVVALGLAWDYFQDVSQLNQSIDSYKKSNSDTSEMESARNRKTVLGITFLAAGVINTVFALKTVEVKATSSSLGLVYHF